MSFDLDDVLAWPRYFFHPPDERWWRLRGGPVFDMWRALGHEVHVGTSGYVGRPAAILMAVPEDPAAADAVEDLGRDTNTAVVVDVTFPLMRPDAIVGTAEAVACWTQPENRNTALRAIRAADAVTVPRADWDGYPGWIDDIAEHNPNVTVLPDLADTHEDLHRFAASLLRVWRSGIDAKDARMAVQLDRWRLPPDRP